MVKHVCVMGVECFGGEFGWLDWYRGSAPLCVLKQLRASCGAVRAGPSSNWGVVCTMDSGAARCSTCPPQQYECVHVKALGEWCF